MKGTVQELPPWVVGLIITLAIIGLGILIWFSIGNIAREQISPRNQIVLKCAEWKADSYSMASSTWSDIKSACCKIAGEPAVCNENNARLQCERICEGERA